MQEKESVRISVKEASDLLGVSQQFIRIGLQTGRLPIGSAVRMSSKWTYQISRKAVEDLRDGKRKKCRTAATVRQKTADEESSAERTR